MDREYFKNPKGKPEFSSGCFWFWNDKIEKRGNDTSADADGGKWRRYANDPFEIW